MPRGFLAMGLVLLVTGGAAAVGVSRLDWNMDSAFVLWALTCAVLAGSVTVLFTGALKSRVGRTSGLDQARFSRFRSRLFVECFILLLVAWAWLDPSTSALEKVGVSVAGILMLHAGAAISDLGYRFLGMRGLFFHHLLEDMHWLARGTN